MTIIMIKVLTYNGGHNSDSSKSDNGGSNNDFHKEMLVVTEFFQPISCVRMWRTNYKVTEMQ